MPTSSAFDTQDRSVRLAGLIQRSLLRGRCPQCQFTDMAVRYVPYDSVGGDFYDFTLAGPGHPGFLVGDVSGHGVYAALITTWILGYVRNAKEEHPQPAGVVAELRSLMTELAEHPGAEGLFCSAFYGVYDPAARILTYCNAGHPAPLLIDRSGKQSAFLQSHCILIGVLPDGQCAGQERGTDIQPGDRLVLYTDGITEAFNASGEQWGSERLAGSVTETRHLPAEQAADVILDTVRRFSQPAGFRDDVTLILIDFP